MATTSPPSALTPDGVRSFFNDLIASLPAHDAPVADWEACFWRWNAFKSRFSGEYSRRQYREAQNTLDGAAELALRYIRESIIPVYDPLDARVREAFLTSPARPALASRLGPQLFARLALEAAAFDPANVELATAESELVSRYQRLMGSATMIADGEPLTLSRAMARQADPDRRKRHAAWQAVTVWTGEHREALHTLFDKLVAVRQQMAENLGEPNYIPVGYRKMGRTDYGPVDVAGFRESIRTHVSPLLAKLRARQATWLNEPAVRAEDAGYYPGLSLGSNAAPIGEQIARAQQLFARLHPTLAAHFQAMVDGELIDLENRPGKRPGAFAIAFDDENKVAILCNSTGSEDDIRTLTHEMGHAFQGWESQPIGPLELRWPTMDACEVHSMGMEFLALREIDAFFGPEDARKFRQLRLILTLTRLPYMAVVDEFQHWVYANPTHGHLAREAEWARLWDLFMPGVDFTGNELRRATRWMLQQHVFSSPFYYIDYALAEIGALQLWQMAEADHAGAMEAFLKLCRLGGTRSLLDFFAEGGLVSPFAPEVFAPLLASVARELAL